MEKTNPVIACTLGFKKSFLVILSGVVCWQVAELEAQSGRPGPSASETRDELTQTLEELEALLKAKDEVRPGAQTHFPGSQVLLASKMPVF